MPDFARALLVAQEWVGSVEGVVMVGQGTDGLDDCIDVWVTQPVELPDKVHGVPVRIRETPPIEAQ